MKPLIVVEGMQGVGDSLHQRAVLRVLGPGKVLLRTPYRAMYHDLIAQGLQVQHKPFLYGELDPGETSAASKSRAGIVMGYQADKIARHGSILAAQFAAAGLKMPPQPDFSLPVPQAWCDKARELLAGRNPGGKPLMVYRPAVANTVWSNKNRPPDIDAYATLYQAIRRRRFFTVSVARLVPGKEWIIGPEQEADIKFHGGELDFETLAGLFAEAQMAFTCAGFAPVLAQAVGTPVIVVYGGNESSKTTQRTGFHLAPTLPIEPDRPCDCHDRRHGCDKTISLPPALVRMETFIAEHVGAMPKVLLFATTYIDRPGRARLLDHWLNIADRLNSDCDVLLVDTPADRFRGTLRPAGFTPHVAGDHVLRMFHSFAGNVGHLGVGSGKDGWGRAFCFGLQAAIDGGYDYVVHIEGDSLFRRPVMPIVRQMQADNVDAASILSVPGLPPAIEVETGLMFFRVGYLRDSGFIARYDWPSRQRFPSPETVIHQILGDRLKLMPWQGRRGYRPVYEPGEVRKLDWITHAHDPAMYDEFVGSIAVADQVKLNLGCGTHRLPGWRNHDKDMDITRPLPVAGNSVDFILAEHVVEHVGYYQAVDFLRECHRVLKPGGVLRVAIPSVVQIMRLATPEYCQFTTKFQPIGATVRGAMHNILYGHGHKAPWTAELVEATLFFAGFEPPFADCAPGVSRWPELQGVDGHGKAIGDEWNAIETVVMEAQKNGS
jgi:SAM-dependent methyltransferase